MSFPSLPNGFYQIILLIFLFTFYNHNQEDNKELLDAQAKSEAAYNDFFLNSTTLSTDSLITTYQIERIITDLNRILKFTDKVKTPEASQGILHQIDSLSLVRDAATVKLGEIRSKLNVLNINLKNSNNTIKLLSQKNRIAFNVIMLVLIGFILYQIGNEGYDTILLNKIKLFKNRTYKNCQSCAKVFSPILLHGKNKDGTTNEGFCIECYDNGEFTNPELTKEEVIDEITKVNGIEVDSKKLKPTYEMSKVKEWLVSKLRSKIEKRVASMTRWNKNPYIDKYEL